MKTKVIYSNEIKISRKFFLQDHVSKVSHYLRCVIIIVRIQLRGTPYALEYFPDDFDRSHTFLTESELKDTDDQTRKWYPDYLEGIQIIVGRNVFIAC
jgi:hypothetical protein